MPGSMPDVVGIFGMDMTSSDARVTSSFLLVVAMASNLLAMVGSAVWDTLGL